jgi:subtilase family serine protease
MKILSLLSLSALAGAVLSCVAMAQTAAPAVRIVNRIDENQLVALKGNINASATGQNDRGAVSPQLQMSGLTLVLSRSAEQQAAFDAYVEGQYDSGSPNFHHWLTAAQVGEEFGPAQADIASITNWLASQGFSVTSVAPDRMTINFAGSAATVERAFHTTIHNLLVRGVPHFANMTDPQIPAALAPVVVGIKGLHNFRPHPLHRTGGLVQFNPDAHGWQKLDIGPGVSLGAGGIPATLAARPRPAATFSSLGPQFTYSGSSYVEEDVAPYDFASMYNVQPLWSNHIDGTGQSIVIIGTSDINTADISAFKSAFGLPAGTTPVMAHPSGGSDPGICTSTSNVCGIGDLQENSLDVEWSGAVAPGAQIVLVNSAYNSQTNPTNDPIFQSAQWVVNNVNVQGSAVYGAHIMSISYGSCELGMGTASNVAYHNLWQTASSEGVAVFVAAGDSGSPACDQGFDAQEGNPYSAQEGLAVNGLASSPYNTAVGGTDLAWCKPTYDSSANFHGCAASDAAAYWNTSNNATNQSTAKGYVPETPWNDTCLNPTWTTFIQSVAPLFSLSAPSNPEAACNFIYNKWYFMNQQNVANGGQQFVLASFVDTVGAGGGASNCVVGDSSNCTASATSTGANYGNLALVNNGWPKPNWQAGVPGIPSDGVRDLPDVSFFAGDGSLNSATLVCAVAAGASCTNLSATSSGGTGRALEIGGTSVATPEMAGVMALINQKAGSPQGNPNPELYSLATKQNYSNCKSEGGTTSNGCSFNDIDQGTISMPCAVSTGTFEGGAQYVSSSNSWNTNATMWTALASPNCTALNSGDAVGTLVSSGTTPAYNAGTAYDLASGLGSLNVANVVTNWPVAAGSAASATVTFAPLNPINSNQSANVTITVGGSSGTPTGTVTLTDTNGIYSNAQALSAGTATFTIPAYTFAATGTVTLTAVYSGDGTYASASNTDTLGVTYVAPPTYSVSVSTPAAITSAGGSTTANATVLSSNGYAGTVTLNCTMTAYPSNAVNFPTCSGDKSVTLNATTTSGTASFTVTTTKASAALQQPVLGNGRGWLGAGSGAVLAFLVFLGVPARRRSWRAMLGMIAFVLALGVFTACGSGGTATTGTGGNNNNNGRTPSSPGMTAGNYTFTVTAAGMPAQSPAPAQTFQVTVQ